MSTFNDDLKAALKSIGKHPPETDEEIADFMADVDRRAFTKAVMGAFCGLFITYEEALVAIANYKP